VSANVEFKINKTFHQQSNLRSALKKTMNGKKKPPFPARINVPVDALKGQQ